MKFGMNTTQWTNRCILFFVLSFCCANAVPQQNAVQETQKLLESVAKHPGVTWIKVSCYSFDVRTPIAVMPKDLDQGGNIYNIQKDRPDLQSLIPALRRTKLKTGGGLGVKLAVTLYDAENTRLVSIYMNPSGNWGYIDSTRVSFEAMPGDLYDWFHENFVGCFEYKDKNGNIEDYYHDRSKDIPYQPVTL
jgi:hypothetical protein